MSYIYIGSKSFEVYNIFKSKSIATKLTAINDNNIEEVFKCYLHDFVMYCGSSESSENTKVSYEVIL